MHLQSLILTHLNLLISASALPSFTNLDKADTLAKRGSSAIYAENLPWTISNLVIFTSSPGSSRQSSISFKVSDKNQNLELNTTCSASFPAGYAPDTNGNWTDCADSDFRFMYGASTLSIQRWWNDPK